MAGSAHIPNSPACGQWETLLADALDGLLRPQDEAIFSGHMANCPACTALFEEARKGREWLEFLSGEPEVPAGLLDKILATTGPGQAAGYGLTPASAGGMVVQMPQPWQRPGFMGFIRRFAEPRLMMTAAMAFFSIALTLNLTGVHITSIRMADLRPTALRSYMRRQITVASTPLIRYYDHLRFVYEVESRVREFRRSTQGDNNDNRQNSPSRPAGQGESQQNPNGKGGGSRVDPPQQSGNPDQSNSTDIFDYSLALQNRPAQSPDLSGDFAAEIRERSSIWIA